jgi:hypothetical protein
MRPVVNPWMRKALRGAGPELRGRILAARRGLRLGWRRVLLPYLLVMSPAVAVIGVAVVHGQLGPHLRGAGLVPYRDGADIRVELVAGGLDRG